MKQYASDINLEGFAELTPFLGYLRRRTKPAIADSHEVCCAVLNYLSRLLVDIPVQRMSELLDGLCCLAEQSSIDVQQLSPEWPVVLMFMRSSGNPPVAMCQYARLGWHRMSLA